MNLELAQQAPFSADDISRLRDHSENGFVSFVEAGTKRYALVISDPDKAAKFFIDNKKSEIRKTYSDTKKAFKGSGTDQEGAIKSAIMSVIKDSGIELYESTDSKKVEFKKVESPKTESD